MSRRRSGPTRLIASHMRQDRVVRWWRLHKRDRRSPLAPGRRRRAPVLHQRRPRYGAAVLFHIAFRASHPPSVTHHPYIDRRRGIPCRPEQVCSEPSRHEVFRPTVIFECPRREPHNGRSIEVIVAPMTLRERRRYERAPLGQPEVRRFRRHSPIVAQQRIV